MVNTHYYAIQYHPIVIVSPYLYWLWVFDFLVAIALCVGVDVEQVEVARVLRHHVGPHGGQQQLVLGAHFVHGDGAKETLPEGAVAVVDFDGLLVILLVFFHFGAFLLPLFVTFLTNLFLVGGAFQLSRGLHEAGAAPVIRYARANGHCNAKSIKHSISLMEYKLICLRACMDA